MPRGRRAVGKEQSVAVSPSPAPPSSQSQRKKPATRAANTSSPTKHSTPTKGKQKKIKATGPIPEEGLAEPRAALSIANLAGWLPEKWLVSIRGCKTETEWKAKVRWLLALIFFRNRFMDMTFMRAILQLLQPTNTEVINSTSVETVTWFRGMNSELQDKIWKAHELLADAYLQHTKVGRQFVEFYNRQTENHRLRPKMLPGNLASSLPLTMNDVRGLWASIEFAAHRGHWEPTSNITKVPAEALRRASYFFITRVIAHWVRGGKLDYQLSISAKSALKDFQASSDLNDPPDWPRFPPQTDRPCSLKSWEAFADIYPLAEDSPLFKALIKRIQLQDAPAVEIQTPERAHKPGGDSLASDSEDYQESSALSSLDSSDEGESIQGDSSSNYQKQNSGNTKAVLSLDDSQLDSSQGLQRVLKDDSPTRHRYRKPGPASMTSIEGIRYDDTSDPIDADLTPKKPKANLSAMNPMSTFGGDPGITSNFKSGVNQIKSLVPEPRLNITAGSTLSFRLDNDQPPELSGDFLPDDRMELVNNAHQKNIAKKTQIVRTFLGDSDVTDDAYYGDSESGHIASLSSVGKAEYAMHCLARDILRYERVICGIAEMKQRDEQMMMLMEERRKKALARHKMMENLERDSMSVNKTTKAMGYAEHQRELDAYGIPHSSFEQLPSTPNSLIQISSSSNQASSWNNQSSPPLFTSSQTHGQTPLFNSLIQGIPLQPGHSTSNQSPESKDSVTVAIAKAAKHKAANHEERRERKRRKIERHREQEQKGLTDKPAVDIGSSATLSAPVVTSGSMGNMIQDPNFPNLSALVLTPATIVQRAEDSQQQRSDWQTAQTQDVESLAGPSSTEPQPDLPANYQVNPGLSTTTALDSQSYTAAFRPRSRPISATDVGENFFATATTAEGIISQKQSLLGPNTGNQFGGETENRNL